MSPIIEIPWHCGERDCPVGWHLATYWLGEGGEFTCDDYSDGDGEDLDSESELPTHEQHDAAWTRYYRDVLATGTDPLQQLMVTYSYERQQRWQIRLGNSIRGVVLLGCRRNSRGPWHCNPPAALADWMLLTGAGNRWALDEAIMERDEYRELLATGDDLEGYQRQRPRGCAYQGVATMTVRVDRAPRAIARDVRAAALTAKVGL